MRSRYISIAIIIVSLFFACSESTTSYKIGGDLIDTNLRIVKIDTLTINTYTVGSDSIALQDAAKVLIGHYQDDDLGVVSSKHYAEFETTDFSIVQDSKFESLSVVLRYDGYYHGGDTLTTKTINVHRVLEKIEGYDNGSLQNITDLEYDTDIIGSKTFSATAKTKDSVMIELPTALGQEFFDKIKNKEITTQLEFKEFFNGLVFVPTDGDAGIIGYNKTIEMSMFYSLDRPEPDTEFTRKVFTSGYKNYNKIHSDRTGTTLESLQMEKGTYISQITLASSETDNVTYVQGGSDLSTKVTIPHLDDLRKFGADATLLEAKLIMYPEVDSYNSNDFRLKDSLPIYIIDNKNKYIKQLTSVSGAAVYGMKRGDEKSIEPPFYSVDITTYINELLTTKEFDNNSLILKAPATKDNTSRIIFNDDSKSKNKSYLEILYAIY